MLGPFFGVGVNAGRPGAGSGLDLPLVSRRSIIQPGEEEAVNEDAAFGNPKEDGYWYGRQQ